MPVIPVPNNNSVVGSGTAGDCSAVKPAVRFDDVLEKTRKAIVMLAPCEKSKIEEVGGEMRGQSPSPTRNLAT
jgi:hypothetical protein